MPRGSVTGGPPTVDDGNTDAPSAAGDLVSSAGKIWFEVGWLCGEILRPEAAIHLDVFGNDVG